MNILAFRLAPLSACTLAVGLALAPMAARADNLSITRTVAKNKASFVLPIMVYGRGECGIYPASDIKILKQPTHGSVRIETGPAKLGASSGVCEGTKANVPWVVYQPARNYTGPDDVVASFMMLNNIVNIGMHPDEVSVAITVK